MDEHSRWLVNDDQVVILKHDVEFDRLGTHCGSAGSIDGDLDEIARPQLISDILVPAIDHALGRFDQIAKVHLAQTAKMVEQKILKPQLEMLRSGCYFHAVDHLKNCTASKPKSAEIS